MLAIHTTKDDNERVWDETIPSRSDSFIFFNFQTCLVKKLNGTGQGKDEKIPKPVPFTFDF